MTEGDPLTPIRTVSEHFAVPISTLHYWERRGLISPRRQAGQRFYDADQLYRVALIKMWRTTGRIGIPEIARMLGAPGWQDTIAEQLSQLEEQLAALTAAHSYLTRLSNCRQSTPERCPEFRASVDLG
ncbi:MerR family transcriptional regulator [Stackebrandtia nassauensis]|uniref:Transcriptional regulator, MerR family n=1 Tax=Stackebrandtia nassauensis (strain DSM 44728 / CIP 108903 / NRRL B-16338 / NBRC 102104 / LLR-40K-21) TaxID=446470 RepID=D3PUC8_STANL|nr:MerR family transcriptional regulator [Stackebrandtia nassauensis]ADD42941.1 transcriptional regulator, MerR family [Stackebrandtia nassauensis DSM 44728]